MSADVNTGGVGQSGTYRSVQPIEPTPKIRQVKSDNEPAKLNNMRDLKQANNMGRHVPLGDEQLIQAIERANKALQGISTSFEFSIHEGTKEIMVKVLDKDTGKVVREIPSEKVLDMVAKFWEMAGIFIDEKR